LEIGHKPWGDPQPHRVKYFATIDLLELAGNRVWLGKVTNAVSRHWIQENQRKKGRTQIPAENCQLAGSGLPGRAYIGTAAFNRS